MVDWKHRTKTISAYNHLAAALHSGKITRPTSCELCGSSPGPIKKNGKERNGLVAHHWNGYDKKLAVWWICRTCNGKLMGPQFHNGSVTKEQARALVRGR